MWRRLTDGLKTLDKTVARKRGWAALTALVLTALLAGPAATQTQKPLPELKPFVPPKPPEDHAGKSAVADAPPAVTPAAEPAAAPSSAAASSASAPPRPKPKAAKPAIAAPATATTGAVPGTAPAALPRSSVPAPQPVAARPVTPVTVQPTGAPATFPTINGAPPPARPIAATPSLVTSQPLPQPIMRDASTPISADDIETFTDSVVRSLMQRDHVMGVTVAVVQGNTPVLVKGYGYDRLSPARRVDPNNSLFRLGSITKTFTWIVARQEIEAGRIKLDAPIANYVPNDVFSEDRRYKPLTLRDLMDHASGYEDTSLGHLFQLNSNRVAGADSYFRRHRPRRVREPGQFSSYSNFAPALAARALTQTAKATDVPSLMEARVFQPLGMDHTSLREPYTIPAGNVEDLPAPLNNTLTQDLSDGYLWDGATYEAQPFDHALPLSGALGASSTAKDMARFMALMLGNGQLDGVQLFNADSARAFRTPMLKMPEGYNGWASGLMIRTTPSGMVTFGHGGSTLWFNSNFVLVPELNLGIFISTNTQTGGSLANAYPNLLLDHLSGDLVRPPLMPTPEQAYARNKDYYNAIKGKYVSTRRAYGGLEGAITRLINTVEVNFDADGRMILTTQTGLSAFVPASARGFFNPQDSEGPGPAAATGGLHFLFDADGNHVSAFETAANMNRYERVGWLQSPDTLSVLTVIMVITCVGVFLSLMFGTGRNERPTEEQARASIVSAGMVVLWLVAIFIFHHWWSNLQDDVSSLFTHWPAGQVQFASWVAFLATLGTAYQVATYYFVYNEQTRYSEGWPEWRKYVHGALLAYWAFYILVLFLWGALPPWSA